MNLPTEQGKKEIRINLQVPSLHVIFPFRKVMALFWRSREWGGIVRQATKARLLKPSQENQEEHLVQNASMTPVSTESSATYTEKETAQGGVPEEVISLHLIIC